MGTNTLPSRSDGVPMPASWFNDIRSLLLLNHVPRNASGAPADEAGSLGDSNYQWSELRAKVIYLDGSLVDIGSITGKPHGITSAAQDATTKYPSFLSAAGVAGGLSCDLLATATNFEATINNVSTTVSSDTTFSSLTAAPAANNTCLINDAGLTGAAASKTLGEIGNQPLVIDTVGSEITSVKGEIHAFKVGTEVFLAEVDTDNDRLLPFLRGWAGTDRSALSNNDTITLMSSNVLLLKNDGSTKVSSIYYPETVTVAPAAGTAGKVYIERDTNKIGYDTGAAIDYGYMIVGFGICDDVDCLNAQPYDLELYWDKTLTAELRIASTTTMSVERNAHVSVNGQDINFSENYDMTQASNMDVGESIAASTRFYVYLKEDGSGVFSTVAPRKYDAIKMGEYHPLKYFRCVGSVFTNSGNSFMLKRGERKSLAMIRDEFCPVGSIVAWNGGYYTDASNGGFTSVLGNTIPALKAILSDNWRVCDGVETYDAESPIFNVSGRFIDNLTDDRFIMGDTTAGSIGGSNAIDLEHNHRISHVHAYQFWEDSTDAFFGIIAEYPNSTSVTASDTKVIETSTLANGGITALYSFATGADYQLYTLGVRAALAGADGTTAASGDMQLSGSTENRPKWLSQIYIRKIK